MSTSQLLDALDEQLRRSMEGPSWHGPSVREALEGFGAHDAAERPIAGAHTCWELVLHLCGTYQLVLRRMHGVVAPLLPHEDWPPAPAPSEQNWGRDVGALFTLNAQLREAVRAFPLERLYRPLIANPPYSAFTQIIGLTQHDLYHAGQIVLLRRALER